MRKKIIAFALSALAVSYWSVSAQDYNDDDIYFDPSKVKKKEAVRKATPTQQPNAIIYYPAQDYPAADSYQTPAGQSTINVDDYNRRGFFRLDTVATLPSDSLRADAFQNTRRIEKFYNPQVVKASGDEELADYYYAEPANVSIIVNTIDPWYYPSYYGAGYWGWRNPWAWGPAWSWSWGWGYTPTWAWGPAWGWGAPAWAWGAPAWAWTHRPIYRPHPTGNSRPPYSTRPGYRPGTSGSYRPSASGYRPGTASGNSGYRPGLGNSRGRANSTYQRQSNSNSNNSNNYNNSGYRSGNSRGSSWGGSTGSGYRGGSSGGGFSRGGGGGRGRH